MHSIRQFFLLVFSLTVPTYCFAAPVDESQANLSLPASEANLKLQIDVFSSQVKNATALCLDDQGRVYVSETYRWRKGIEDNRDHTYWIMDDLAAGTVEDRSALYAKWKDRFQDEQYFTRYSDRVLRLVDSNADGKADATTVFADGFRQDVDGPAIGLLSGPLGIYLASIPHLWLLQDPDGDGVSDQRKSLQDGFGVKNSLSGHDLHGLVWGPDGKLYFSMGDRGFHCETEDGRILSDPNSGAVFRCNPDGSEMEIFYHRLRNPQEIAFNEYGDLFTVDNNCDQGDSARVCYLIEGGDTGWNLGAQALTTYKASIDDGQMDQIPHWLSEGMWQLEHPGQPAHILPPIAHLTNGPSGLAFDSGTSLPDRYRNHFLVCDYKGAPNLCFLYSFKVNLSGAGYTMQDAHMLHGGIANTDVTVGYDGKIYLTDFGGGWIRSDQGNIYSLYDLESIKRPIVKETANLFQQGFAALPSDELATRLDHDDMRVRQRCQFELVKRGDKRRLAIVAQKGQSAYARFHAIWGLGQLKATSELLKLLQDDDAEIRAQSARAIGNTGNSTAAAAIRPLILDDEPRVRTFATIAAGKLQDRQALKAVIQFAANQSQANPFERHAAVFALSRIATPQQLMTMSQSDSLPVRLTGLLALRRNRDPRIAKYLSDQNTMIVDEAIRAINDENLTDAVPLLATYSQRYTGSINDVPNAMIFRRLINACLRSARPSDAETLLQFAANATLPKEYRLLALKALEHFDAPPSIDPTVGLYRPLPSRDITSIREVLAQPSIHLFESSNGDIAAATIRVMRHFGIRLSEKSLIERIRDGRQPEEVRRVALEQLVSDQRFDQKLLLKSLLVDESPLLRTTATLAYLDAFPDESTATLQGMIEFQTDQDLRTAYRILQESESATMAQLLVSELDKLMKGQLHRTVHLDLYQAAKKSPHKLVNKKLAEVDSFLAQQGLNSYDFTREGGDPVRGQLVFQNQGVCMKCHQGDRGGGDAGPPLTDIGRLRRAEELLESIIDPNANVVDGFGSVTVFLADGTSATGTILDDDKQALVLKTPTGNTIEIPVEQIEERSPISSPMPKQAENLTPNEIRDLLAYLLQLKGKP